MKFAGGLLGRLKGIRRWPALPGWLPGTRPKAPPVPPGAGGGPPGDAPPPPPRAEGTRTAFSVLGVEALRKNIPGWRKGSLVLRLPKGFRELDRTARLKEAARGLLARIPVKRAGAWLFDPASRPAIHKAFVLALTCASAWLAGGLAGSLLSPKRARPAPVPGTSVPPGPSASSLASIGRTDLFKAEGSLSKIPSRVRTATEETCHEADRKSALPIRLLNTIVIEDSVKSLAAVQVRNDDGLLGLREGDSVPELAKIEKIGARRVVLRNLDSGECEYVESPLPDRTGGTLRLLEPGQDAPGGRAQGEEGIVNVGNSFRIRGAVRDEILSNISEVLTQARAVQIQNPDGTLSFRMTEIVPDSIYSKLNIQEGDVISSINGRQFTNLGDVMGLFPQINETTGFRVTLERDGEPQTMEYTFED